MNFVTNIDSISMEAGVHDPESFMSLYGGQPRRQTLERLIAGGQSIQQVDGVLTEP